MVPLVHSRQDAERAVAYCKYPPAGQRSVAYPVRMCSCALANRLASLPRLMSAAPGHHYSALLCNLLCARRLPQGPQPHLIAQHAAS